MSFATSWKISLHCTMVFVFCTKLTLLFAWEIHLLEDTEGRRYSNYHYTANTQ